MFLNEVIRRAQIKKLFILIFSFFMVACQSQSVLVESVANSHQCNNAVKKIDIIRSKFTLNDLMSNPNVAGSSLSADEYDFERYLYIFIGAGNKPSAGYRYEQVGEQAIYTQGKVILPFVLIEPSANMMVAQILTSPCVLLRINRSTVEEVFDSRPDFILKDDI